MDPRKLSAKQASGQAPSATPQRVHILTGTICNNNCLFCMEDDRDARCIANSAMTDEAVRAILDAKRGFEEVCFTSGEPTTNPRLPLWARWARARAIPRVSVMTNGRKLCYAPYTRALVAAGVNRFYVSIHGHTAALHESLTRTPGSFDQTVAGLSTVAAFKRYGVELNTSTVVTRRNLPHLGAIYAFLRERGVDEVVFNVMQPYGRADEHFDRLFPAYSAIAAEAADFLRARIEQEPRPMAFFVDLPLCTTEGLPDFHRGYVESYVHYEPPAGVQRLDGANRLLDGERRDIRGTRLVGVRRSDIDGNGREKREACRRCRYDAVCPGVWSNYLRRFGWDELVPVE